MKGPVLLRVNHSGWDRRGLSCRRDEEFLRGDASVLSPCSEKRLNRAGAEPLAGADRARLEDIEQ